jgi:rRNA-processing protein FCF1
MKIVIDKTSFEIQLAPFKMDGNGEYMLLDTGCVLWLLKKISSVFYQMEKRDLKIAILEKTISEVAEHLSKSKESLAAKNAPAFHIEGAAQNFRKILEDNRIMKLANPRFTSNQISEYKNFGEDSVLAYALFQGNFKAIATKDGPFARRLRKDKFVSCDLLFK